MEPHTINIDLEQDDDLGFATFQHHSSDPDDYEFDCIVQKLQEIILSSDYEQVQKQFFNNNCSIFEDTQQNKVEYMDIFHKYQLLIEDHLIKELEMLPNFSMQRFQELLETRKDQIDQQILDMILSSIDFMEFKSLILDAKKQKYEEQKLDTALKIKSNVQK